MIIYGRSKPVWLPFFGRYILAWDTLRRWHLTSLTSSLAQCVLICFGVCELSDLSHFICSLFLSQRLWKTRNIKWVISVTIMMLFYVCCQICVSQKKEKHVFGMSGIRGNEHNINQMWLFVCRMWDSKQFRFLLTSIVFTVYIMDVNGNQACLFTNTSPFCRRKGKSYRFGACSHQGW